jgi:hypothetical protein
MTVRKSCHLANDRFSENFESAGWLRHRKFLFKTGLQE